MSNSKLSVDLSAEGIDNVHVVIRCGQPKYIPQVPDTHLTCSLNPQTSIVVASDPTPRNAETQPKGPDLQEQVSKVRKELRLLVDFSEGLLADLTRRRGEIERELGRTSRLKKFKKEEEEEEEEEEDSSDADSFLVESLEV